MKYLSTRGRVKDLEFTETVFEGLSPDGGLFLPEKIPSLSEEEIKKFSSLSYKELAFQIFKKFISDIPSKDLRELVERAYSSFRIENVVNVREFRELFLLELFYGPTWAFKDVALQFLGVLFEYLLLKTGKKINILGATSGDTGSAAIYGVKGKKNINIFILYPYQRVSRIQELMMTTVQESNVFCIALRGTFDDCQRIVKELFMDLEFKQKMGLTAVNSINWSRILAQVVYYIWAYLRVCEKLGERPVRFSVPTGNFGDIFAGYVAREMLGKHRIDRLILATNENDILARFVNYGDYSVRKVKPTISPSMDIQVASNFERYLFYLLNGDGERVSQRMEEFKKTGKMDFSEEELKKVRGDFLAGSFSEEETLRMIKEFYEREGYILDPHTAVGVGVGLRLKGEFPLISLATAHYVKFPETIEKALGKKVELPEEIQRLTTLPRRYQVFSEKEDVKAFILEKALNF